MPFKTIIDFQKSFPGVKTLTPHQKQIALNIFNSAKEAGDDDGKAIAKAIGAARKMKAEEMPEEEMKKKKEEMMKKDEMKKKEEMMMKKEHMMSEGIRVLSLAEIQTDHDLETKEFEVLRTGEFYDARYGKFQITEDILDDLVKHFNENVLEIEVALDTNHEPEKGAKAWVKSLRKANGRLYAMFKDYTQEAQQYFKEKIYKYFSVEFAPFTKVEEGKKTIIKNVLRGIALTNRPVIKGMQPTFLSEIIKTKNDMSIVKLLADELLKRERISKDDVSMLKTAFTSLSEDEQVEVQESVEQVEAKAEESVVAEAKATEEAAKTEAEAAAKAAEEAKVSGDVDSLEAAEKRAKESEVKLAEATKMIAQYEEEKQARVLSERVSALTLSEKNSRGFSSALKDSVTDFVGSLSDEQYTQFSELISKYAVVNLAELGSASAGSFADGAEVKFGSSKLPVTGVEQDAQIRALAEKEKLSYFEAAIKFAQKSNN